jgi:hypothetical protein
VIGDTTQRPPAQSASAVSQRSQRSQPASAHTQVEVPERGLRRGRHQKWFEQGQGKPSLRPVSLIASALEAQRKWKMEKEKGRSALIQKGMTRVIK